MNRRDRFLLGCGPAAGAVLFIAVVWASAATPGINQSSDTISRLAAPGQPHAWILRTGLVLCGVLSIAFGAGLLGAPRRGVFRWGVLAGLVVFGVSTAITGLARDYPLRSGSEMGREGEVHNLYARVAIYGILAAMAAFIPAAAGRRPARMAAVVFSVVALVLVAATGLFYPAVPPAHRGLVQRLALIIIFAWMAATAVIARRAAGR
ncbi:MAG: DUF998 domain-containing protein [Candidatus Aminicenantales bacterium]